MVTTLVVAGIICWLVGALSLARWFWVTEWKDSGSRPDFEGFEWGLLTVMSIVWPLVLVIAAVIYLPYKFITRPVKLPPKTDFVNEPKDWVNNG